MKTKVTVNNTEFDIFSLGHHIDISNKSAGLHVIVFARQDFYEAVIYPAKYMIPGESFRLQPSMSYDEIIESVCAKLTGNPQ